MEVSMNNLKLIAYLFLISILSFGCQKENSNISPLEEEINADLKVFKVIFEGVRGNPLILNHGKMKELSNGTIRITGMESEWSERTTTQLANGVSHWEENILISKNKKTANLRGKGKLILPDGEWNFTMKGSIKAKGQHLLTPNSMMNPVPCESTIRVHGVGKSGPVTGLVGEWIYTLDYDGSSPYQYNIEGKIHFNYN